MFCTHIWVQMSFICIVLLLVTASLQINAANEEKDDDLLVNNEEHQQWVDPGNMLDLNLLGPMHKEKLMKLQVEAIEHNVRTIKEPVQVVQDLGGDTDSQSSQKKSAKSKCKCQCINNNIYFKRLVSDVHSKLSSMVNDDTTIRTTFSVNLNKLSLLRQLKDNDKYVPGAYEFLRALVPNMQPVEDQAWSENFENFVGLSVTTVLLVILAISSVIHSFWIFSKIKLNSFYIWFSLLIFVSFLWTYFQQYQENLAQRAQLADKLDQSCHHQSWWKWLKDGVYVSSDDCAINYRNLYVTTLLDLSPVRVLSIMIGSMIVEPADYIGKSMNIFVMRVLQDMPYVYQMIMLPLLLIFIAALVIFVILVACGYGINFFHFVKFVPRSEYQQTTMLKNENNWLNLQVEESKKTIIFLKERLKDSNCTHALPLTSTLIDSVKSTDDGIITVADSPVSDQGMQMNNSRVRQNVDTEQEAIGMLPNEETNTEPSGASKLSDAVL